MCVQNVHLWKKKQIMMIHQVINKRTESLSENTKWKKVVDSFIYQKE